MKYLGFILHLIATILVIVISVKFFSEMRQVFFDMGAKGYVIYIIVFSTIAYCIFTMLRELRKDIKEIRS